MTITQSHINSGFRNIAITEASGNVIGANIQVLTVPTLADFTIGGGTAGQALTTDGAGNLRWETIPGVAAIADYMANGTSNVFMTPDSPITISSNGAANLVTVSGTGTTMSGIVDMNGIANIQLAGGNPDKFIQTDGAGNLRWGPDQYKIPEYGHGYGRMFAQGKRIWTAGSGGRVYATGSGLSTFFSTTLAITQDEMPAPIPPLTSWVKIYDASGAIYALGDNGVMYSMGLDDTGQNGLTPTDVRQIALKPMTWPNLFGPGITVENFWAPVDYADAGNQRVCCLVQVMDNGTRRFLAWGFNQIGALGLGNTTDTQVPVEIPILRNKQAASVSMTDYNTYVVTTTGEVWAAGEGTHGQLGIGTTTNSSIFVQCQLAAGSTAITTAVEVATSIYQGTGVSTFIRLADGTLVAAGWNSNGNLGVGDTTRKTRFTQVLKSAGVPLTNVVKVDTRSMDFLALDNTGALWSAGYNYSGWWGNGDSTSAQSLFAKSIQTAVADFWFITRQNGWRAITFRKTDGTTWGCGDNQNFQIGADVAGSSGIITDATRIYYTDSDEYAVRIKPLGSAYFDGTNWTTLFASIHLTNKNRIYVTGNMGQYTGAFSPGDNITFSYSPVPIPITDVKYY